MIGLVGTQIWWTFSVEDVFRRVARGNVYAMKEELKKETDDLNSLIMLVRQDIPGNLRKLVNTLIILDVHSRILLVTSSETQSSMIKPSIGRSNSDSTGIKMLIILSSDSVPVASTTVMSIKVLMDVLLLHLSLIDVS
jgi:hypothetical protein